MQLFDTEKSMQGHSFLLCALLFIGLPILQVLHSAASDVCEIVLNLKACW